MNFKYFTSLSFSVTLLIAAFTAMIGSLFGASFVLCFIGGLIGAMLADRDEIFKK